MIARAAEQLQYRWERLLLRRRAPRSRFAAFGARTYITWPVVVTRPESVALGADVVINAGAFISVYPAAGWDGPHVAIGDRAQLGSHIVIACAGRIEIGADVLTADRVFIGDTIHAYEDPTRPIKAQGLTEPRPVRIGDGAFLGIGSCVMPGVTIGEGAVVGAGAVVTSDVPPRTVVAGVPARPVREYDDATGRWVSPRASHVQS